MNGPNRCSDNCSSSQPCHQMPNMDMVRGILALAFGGVFIAIAYSIVLYVLLLVIGLALIYYGLRVLRLNFLTDPVDTFFRRVAVFLRS